MSSTRERILEAAVGLLDAGGPEAMSTRAVSAAADAHAPEIYRLFGDKRGLLDAVTSRKLDEYLSAKTNREVAADPVEDLRRGWDLHVGFGLDNPAVYAAIYGQRRSGDRGPAVAQADAVLLGMVGRVAAAGRLRVDEGTAAQLIHAAGVGLTLTLINTPAATRDMGLSRLAREAVIAAVTTSDEDRPAPDPDPVVTASVTLRSAVAALEAFTPAERMMLTEWLDRLIASGGSGGGQQGSPGEGAV